MDKLLVKVGDSYFSSTIFFERVPLECSMRAK
jgi:hypothetical protein